MTDKSIDSPSSTLNKGVEVEKKPSKLEEKVVVSNKIITSRGPGLAMLFGYTICEKVLPDGPKIAEQLKKGMMFI